LGPEIIRILAYMLYRFASGGVSGGVFYASTAVVFLLRVVEAGLVHKLGELEDRADADGPSPFRIVARPLAYAFGLLLFLLFDEHNAQFIYSQF
jgi:hypothetical protein